MTQLKPILSYLEPIIPSTGKFRSPPYAFHRLRFHPRLTLWSFLFLSFLLLFFFCSPPAASPGSKRRRIQNTRIPERSRLGPNWEAKARNSARPQSNSGLTILVTGAAGFVGTHVSLALKKRGDGVVGLDNFNNYYETGLKKARKSLLERQGVYIIDADINDAELLSKLFEVVHFTHVMHLAAQAGVRYAMQNPHSYIHSNVNGFVTLLEACKNANPQPSIVWASSSSVYGLNSKVPFSEKIEPISPPAYTPPPKRMVKK